MIYETILSGITDFLISGDYFDEDEILVEDQIASPNLELFCRLYWSLGTETPVATALNQEVAIFNIDIFERPGSTNNAFEYATSIRKSLLHYFPIIKDTIYDESAKISNVSITKNMDDEYIFYNISVVFNIYD